MGSFNSFNECNNDNDISFGDFDVNPTPEQLYQLYDGQHVVFETREFLETIEELDESLYALYENEAQYDSSLDDAGYDSCENSEYELIDGSDIESASENGVPQSKNPTPSDSDPDSSPTPSDSGGNRSSDSNSDIVIEGPFYSSDDGDNPFNS